MKNYTITIPDNKENIFVEMMKSIPYIKNIKEATFVDIPKEHKEIVRNRIQGLEEHPESCLSWADIEQKIKL